MDKFVAHLLWMIHILKNYGLNYKNIEVICDNVSIINLTKNSAHHSKTKYIKVKHHLIQEHVATGDIILDYVKSK